MSLKNKHPSEDDEHSSSYEDDDDEEIGEGEEMNVLEKVQGLFSTEIFPDVIEMFRAYQNQFDLLKFVQKHQIVSQYDYIRLINYIRREVRSLKPKEKDSWHKFHLFRNHRSMI